MTTDEVVPGVPWKTWLCRLLGHKHRPVPNAELDDRYRYCVRCTQVSFRAGNNRK